MEQYSSVESPRDEIITAPIVTFFNEKFHPILDALEKVRELDTEEDVRIRIPTIVVVGDQSCGKSSVLESLTRISLPKGQGICTRAPLIMRLENHSSPKSVLTLKVDELMFEMKEEEVTEAIKMGTREIAGNEKGLCSRPLTLTVKKQGVPNLRMVDLPGITRVSVEGQPQDIYAQIKDMIVEYVRPEESIILNVISATQNFTTCESMGMSRSLDETGERTLIVVTECDKSREPLLADDGNLGLGYIYVRNRVGKESYEDACREEEKLFQSHPLMSKIDKSVVGVPVLAQKIVQIQAASISKNLPKVMKKIDEILDGSVSELNSMPKKMGSVADVLIRVIGLARDTLKRILITGEFENLEDEHMHGTVRIFDMLKEFANQLHESAASDPAKDFLMDEIRVLEQCRCIELPPNYSRRRAFLRILQMKMRGIESLPIGFMKNFWRYIEEVVVGVLFHHSDGYHLLQLSIKKSAHNLIAKMKNISIKHVTELVEMERLSDYTCDEGYMNCYNTLMSQCEAFLACVFNENQHCRHFEITGIGQVEIRSLWEYSREILQQAFEVRIRITAYWKIVINRQIDCIALHLRYSIINLLNKQLEDEIVKGLSTPNVNDLERLLDVSPSLVTRREKLNESITKLTELKSLYEDIMDNLSY